MKVVIDSDERQLTIFDGERRRVLDLYSDEAFAILSDQWLKVGWNQKYTYSFSWLGRPVIQLPEDLIRIQEVIYAIKPDVIIETGVAHGGSVVFYASLCSLMGKGRVVGVDILIRPANRRAIESHAMASKITLIEAGSTEPATLNRVRSLITPGDSVFVILDSRHDKAHVLRELELYGQLVTSGSYVVATDGIMKDLHDVPRGRAEWSWDNPAAAVFEFLRTHADFTAEQPTRPFNESTLTRNVTHWPAAWLKRT